MSTMKRIAVALLLWFRLAQSFAPRLGPFSYSSASTRRRAAAGSWSLLGMAENGEVDDGGVVLNKWSR